MLLTPKTLGFTVLFAIGLSLSAGSASAGTVNINCSCTPDTPSSPDEPDLLYCICEERQALSALATNEYRRRCTATGAVNASSTGDFNNLTMTSNRPKNVSCTITDNFGPLTPDYTFNQCTNWALKKQSFTVLSYCISDNR